LAINSNSPEQRGAVCGAELLKTYTRTQNRGCTETHTHTHTHAHTHTHTSSVGLAIMTLRKECWEKKPVDLPPSLSSSHSLSSSSSLVLRRASSDAQSRV